MCFVITCTRNIAPGMGIELLNRLTKLFKDYCGVLTEESIRTNFVLIYELLGEIIDFGYLQNTSTENLKAFVFNEPTVMQSQKQSSRVSLSMNAKTTPSTAVDKPINLQNRKGRKNEIFVDIFERVSLTFNSNGCVLSAAIDGTIQMKSYLAGNPELKIALNEELVVGKGSGGVSYGQVIEVDDCNFHECARLDGWGNERVLSFQPPDGEFVLMNYRITSDFRAPFRVFPFFELLSPYKVELIIKVRADIPDNKYGGNVQLVVPMPKHTSSVAAQLGVGVVGE